MTLIGGGGAGATATATTSVSAIKVDSGGSLYTSSSPPPVTLIGGGGTGASATATVDASGVVSGITIVSGGNGYTSAPTVTIGPSGPIVSSIAINSQPADAVVNSLTVTVNIQETFDPDLTLTLIAPDGTRVLLAANVGAGLIPQNFNGTTFDDTASRSITSGSAPFIGSYTPQQPLSQLNGKLINSGTGAWKLEIRSAGNAFASGSLTNWSLNIIPGRLSNTLTKGNLLDQNANGDAGEPSGDVYVDPRPGHHRLMPVRDHAAPDRPRPEGRRHPTARCPGKSDRPDQWCEPRRRTPRSPESW